LDFRASQFPLSGNINTTYIPQVVVGTLTSDQNEIDYNDKHRGNVNDVLCISPESIKDNKSIENNAERVP